MSLVCLALEIGMLTTKTNIPLREFLPDRSQCDRSPRLSRSNKHPQLHDAPGHSSVHRGYLIAAYKSHQEGCSEAQAERDPHGRPSNVAPRRPLEGDLQSFPHLA